MADMTPVGNTVNPASSGLSSLSDILGIQQKRIQLQQQAQTLQTGAYAQQTAQATAQESQQAMGERQLLKSSMASGIDEKGQSLYNDQNQLDPDKMIAFANRALPLTGQPVVQNIIKTQNDKTQLASSVEVLQGKYRDDASGIVRSFLNKPGTKPGDIMDALTTYARQNPQAAQVVLDVGNYIKDAPPATDMKHQNDMLLHLSQQLQPAGTTATQQQPSVSGVNVGGSVNLVQSNPQAPGGIAQVGSMGTSIPPGWSLTEDPVTHNKYMINAQTGESRPLPGSGGNANNAPPQRQPGQGEADVASAKGVTDRLQAAKAAEYERPQVLDALSRARAILSKPDAPDLGTSFEIKTYLKNALSSLGIDTQGATDSNELVKNLARAEAARAQSSSVGNTDAGRHLLSQGTGNTHIDNQAALNIIDQSMATEMAGRGYIKAVGKHQGDPVAMQAAEGKYLSTPNLIQSHELGLKKNAAEVDQFLRQNGLKKGDLDSSVRSLKDQGAL